MAGLLSIDAPNAAAAGYVFSAPDFFLATPSLVGDQYRLTISDFTLDNPGPDILSGVNDRIATLTVRPSAALTGPIRLFVDPAGSFLEDGDGNPLPLGTTPSFVIAPSAVPEPSSLILATSGVGLLLVRRRLLRRPR